MIDYFRATDRSSNEKAYEIFLNARHAETEVLQSGEYK
jgi:hypothetical protein